MKIFMNGLTIIISIYFFYSCQTIGKETLQDKSYVNHENLLEIPDSVLKDKDLTKIILSPSLIIYGPLGGSEEVPGKNNIKVIPDEICLLNKLRVLDLAMNDIKQLPGCFDQLQNLEELDLSGNFSLDLQQAIPKLLLLKRLKKLNLYGVRDAIDAINVRSQLAKLNCDIIITKADLAKHIEHK